MPTLQTLTRWVLAGIEGQKGAIKQVHTIPPHSPPPEHRKSRTLMVTALVVAALFLAGIKLLPFLRTLVANYVSPAVLPEPHFVGKHGANKKVIVFVHGVM